MRGGCGAGGSLCAGLLLTFISAGKCNSSGLERLRGRGSHLLFRACSEFKQQVLFGLGVGICKEDAAGEILLLHGGLQIITLSETSLESRNAKNADEPGPSMGSGCRNICSAAVVSESCDTTDADTQG